MAEQSLQFEIQTVRWIGTKPSAGLGWIPRSKIKLHSQFPVLEVVTLSNNQVEFTERVGGALNLKIAGQQFITF